MVVHDIDNPEVAVCYPSETLTECLEQAGFALTKVEYGNWRGNASPQFQDTLVLKKVNRLPDDFDPDVYLKLNEDLRVQGNINAFWHYEVYGRKEGRRCR